LQEAPLGGARNSDQDSDYIAELFAGFGPVAVRRMFGGAGVFADGLMIALLADGVIFLKADGRTIAKFESEGLGPFTYETKSGTRSLNSYWRMPERLYDAPDELAGWASLAMEAARRAAGKAKSPRKRR
jgi:DNA transformation protein